MTFLFTALQLNQRELKKIQTHESATTKHMKDDCEHCSELCGCVIRQIYSVRATSVHIRVAA